MKIKHLLAASAAIVAISSPALAQEYNGTSGTGVSSTTVNSTTSATTDIPVGCNSTATCLSVLTTTVNQTVGNTTAATTTATTPTTVNGVTGVTGTKTVSGAGGQVQTVTSTLTSHFNPGPPPSFAFSDPVVVGSPVNVGSPSVTALSVSGSATSLEGENGVYFSSLTSSGLNSSTGVATATENSSTLTSSGALYEQRVGTASYNSSTGVVTVTLPTAATKSTSIGASGLALTGGASIDMGGAKITNLGDGTISATSKDAVNGSQLSAFQTSITGQLATFQASVNGQITNLTSLVHRFNKRLEGGIAVATALSGATFLPDKKINITANVGAYRGETAAALQLGALVSENVAVNAGVATGFNSGAGTAFRGGLTFGF